MRHYQLGYSALTAAKIPDMVDLIGYDAEYDLGSLDQKPSTCDLDEVKVRFSLLGDKPYWVRAIEVLPLFEDEGLLNQTITCWKTFPLSLANKPAAEKTNTVYFPRQLPLSSLKADNDFATDEHYHDWVYITADNESGQPISGWVNITQRETGYLQPQIKRMSPGAWTDFNPIEGTVNVANLVEKNRSNRKMTLNLDDYTDVISALHKILTETPLNEQSPYDLLPFTEKQLKAGLRTPWTAEQIGRLLVKYESEWYADESLSKWHEIDSLYQKQYDQKKQSIADELTQANITKPAERDYAMQILDKSYQQQTDEWQIEKQQRIKPSLWWREVAEGQAAQASTKTEGNADKAPEPVLSNLCAQGNVWHFHPVGMFCYTNKNDNKLKTSQKGIDFIYSAEALPGVSNRLHWPGGSSGITLGPGYDMKLRSKESIKKDLLSLNIPTDIAEKISQASGLKNKEEIKDFIKENKNVITLNSGQEKLLLQKIVPTYEKIVERSININLGQNEYDALVSFVYNVGSISKNLANFINQEQKQNAMNLLEQYNKSGGVVSKGLAKRRAKERELFELGIYAEVIY